MALQLTQGTGKVRVIPFLFEYFAQTNGLVATPRYIDIDVADGTDLGPHVEAISFHTHGDNVTPQFQWQIVGYWSIDARVWSAPFALFAFTAAGSAAPTIQADFNDVTKLGVKMRYALAVQNASGTNIESGYVTAAGAFRLRT